MKKTEQKRIALITFSDPLMYPPILNACSILKSNGYEVDIIGIRNKTFDFKGDWNEFNLFYVDEIKIGFSFLYSYINFLFKINKMASKNKYDWMFCYNHKAVFAVYVIANIKNIKWLYHNHDLSIINNFGFNRVLKWIESWAVDYADIISFPQIKRAKFFKTLNNIKKQILIVYNAPLLNWNQNSIKHQSFNMINKESKIILYQGELSSTRGLMNLIKAIPLLNDNIILFLIGKSDLDPNFKKRFNELSKTLKVANRIFIFDSLSYFDLPNITNFCHIGVGVLSSEKDDSSINIKHLFGASNKIFEYMACGLPIIVPYSKEYFEQIELKKLGFTVDPLSEDSIANAINKTLDKSNYDLFSRNVKNIFINKYNYNEQFKKILELL